MWVPSLGESTVIRVGTGIPHPSPEQGWGERDARVQQSLCRSRMGLGGGEQDALPPTLALKLSSLGEFTMFSSRELMLQKGEGLRGGGKAQARPMAFGPACRAHLASELVSSWKPRSWDESSERFSMGLALAKGGRQ